MMYKVTKKLIPALLATTLLSCGTTANANSCKDEVEFPLSHTGNNVIQLNVAPQQEGRVCVEYRSYSGDNSVMEVVLSTTLAASSALYTKDGYYTIIVNGKVEKSLRLEGKATTAVAIH